MPSISRSKFILYLFLFVTASLIVNFDVTQNQNKMLVSANKKTDILFLKGKFILKDKKGSIVISDDKKPCHCPHYFR